MIILPKLEKRCSITLIAKPGKHINKKHTEKIRDLRGGERNRQREGEREGEREKEGEERVSEPDVQKIRSNILHEY